MEHRREFIDNLQYGKQIGKISDFKSRQKRPQAKKLIFLGRESEKSKNQIPYFDFFEKYIKDAPKKTVQNGSYAFPNELTRFPNEAKPIWVEIQKTLQTCSHNLNGALIFQIENN